VWLFEAQGIPPRARSDELFASLVIDPRNSDVGPTPPVPPFSDAAPLPQRPSSPGALLNLKPQKKPGTFPERAIILNEDLQMFPLTPLPRLRLTPLFSNLERPLIYYAEDGVHLEMAAT